jgi:hypothetical protein
MIPCYNSQNDIFSDQKKVKQHFKIEIKFDHLQYITFTLCKARFIAESFTVITSFTMKEKYYTIQLSSIDFDPS